MRLPWDGTSGLALERTDRPGLASFLTQHRGCGGGIDVRRLPGEDGSMIRVTCTHCGRAIEAQASSWEGWWEEQALEAPAPRRRFEPQRERLPRRRENNLPPKEPPAESSGGTGWRQVLLAILIVAWTVAGLLLIASAIAR
jgi:hypothetical protein